MFLLPPLVFCPLQLKQGIWLIKYPKGLKNYIVGRCFLILRHIYRKIASLQGFQTGILGISFLGPPFLILSSLNNDEEIIRI
jgi:hypothetical protein